MNKKWLIGALLIVFWVCIGVVILSFFLDKQRIIANLTSAFIVMGCSLLASIMHVNISAELFKIQ